MLIGDQWPSLASVEAIAAAATSRRQVSSNLSEYADLLLGIKHQNLAAQDGLTAEASRTAYEEGAVQSARISQSNVAKGAAYLSAHAKVSEFRDTLRSLAESGNVRIDEINDSQSPLPTKVAEILAVVTQIREDAFLHSAACMGHISDQIRAVLDSQGVDSGPQSFAADHGVGPFTGRPNDFRDLEAEIARRVDSGFSGTTNDPGSGNSAPALAGQATPPTADEPRPVAMTGPQPVTPADPDAATSEVNLEAGVSPATASPVTTAAPASVTPDAPSNARTPVEEATAAPGSTSDNDPDRQARNVDTGPPTGAALSRGMEAMAGALPHTTNPAPSSSPLIEAALGDSATQVFEPGHTGAPEAGLDPVPPSESNQTIIAASPAMTPGAVPTATGTVTPVASTAPHGSLPAYAADWRPVSATAVPAPASASATPRSAPTNSASASGPTSQLTAVRRQSPPTADGAAGWTERAFAATSSGATTRAAATGRAAQERLRRLLSSVARQRPELRWAVGDLEDGTTRLVTDLAGGWIPPQVEIPSGVRTLRPGLRRNDLTALLGEATLATSYEPGGQLTSEDEPVAMSIRARETTPVEDLGWELSQATKWRDGLPRLAHTLARAACANTGFLDSEARLLREHLDALARAILNVYPSHIDDVQIGNWQLMATVESLISGEKISAHYHFAWFRAQALTPEARR